ncbi:4-hydroxy-2-oxoheptanedioate aldolase [Sphingomonas jinjuensis]|uniref:4-hydroxy-2-oxoheptanedioate aldolase n=1 Tax=Sphingomonas jinjuensis TaxID=535907 RepID=A0A840FQX5_9SPHN|nr:aldolase/citrate lyase family protein [Sphingomonas jinjuensis]MBB4155665.1 4-hydroxy-2-oxoheptanedioate aldolase [Sphingomonas jinjuensis]
MRANTLRTLKAAGRPIVNAWASIGAPYAVESIAHQGFDAVTIDAQHGMMGFDVALAMLQAVSTTSAIPMVRPSGLIPGEIMRWLDAGSYGIICPMISTADDARALVRACRYPPHGQRSFGPARGLLYGGADYLHGADREILVLAMIETREGLENVEAIVGTDGIDGIYVGPNDLALALGHLPANESVDPTMRSAIERIRAVTVAHGKIAGIFCSDGQAAAERVAQGFDLVTPGNDAALLRATMARQVEVVRSVSVE